MSKKIFNVSLRPVEVKDADQDQKPLLEKAQKENGMIPNMYKNMVNLPGLQENL